MFNPLLGVHSQHLTCAQLREKGKKDRVLFMLTKGLCTAPLNTTGLLALYIFLIYTLCLWHPH